MANIVI